MALERYSAVHMMGAPLEGVGGHDTAQILRVLAAYDIEAQEVPRDPTDITPYYWRNPVFRYFVSLAHPEGPAAVDLMPCHDDSDTFLLEKLGDFAVGIQLPGYRHIEIPTDEQTMAIVGPSPRFPDKMCVHELITYTE